MAYIQECAFVIETHPLNRAVTARVQDELLANFATCQPLIKRDRLPF